MDNYTNPPSPNLTWYDPKTNYKPLLDDLFKQLPDTNCVPLRILNPGCGRGRVLRDLLAELCTRQISAEIIAIEPDDKFRRELEVWLETNDFIYEEKDSVWQRNCGVSQIRVEVLNLKLEKYLADLDKNNQGATFDLILCLLVLHYVPHCLISILQALYERLSIEGVFVFDRLRGERAEASGINEDILPFIDSDVNKLVALSDNLEPELLAWKKFYIDRLFSIGAFWCSVAKATDMSLVTECLTPLFEYHCQLDIRGASDIEMGSSHLPWWWASTVEERKAADEFAERHKAKLKPVFEFHVFRKKVSKTITPEYKKLCQSAAVSKAHSYLGAVLWSLNNRRAFHYMETHRFVNETLPRVLQQILSSCGLFHYDTKITSYFFAAGSRVPELRLHELSDLYISIKDTDGIGEQRVQTWLQNYVLHKYVLGQPLSRDLITSGLKVGLSLDLGSTDEACLKENGFLPQSIPSNKTVAVPNIKTQLHGTDERWILWGSLLRIPSNVKNVEAKVIAELKDYIDKVLENDATTLNNVLKQRNIPLSNEQLLPLHLLLSQFKNCLFIPLPSFYEQDDNVYTRSILGLGVTVNDLSQKTFDEVDDLIKFADSLLRRFQDNFISLRWLELSREASLRSAIAAIMGRNMSHNLGSHALGYLAEQKTFDASQTRAFFRYVQKRMDFIAQISTAPPSWGLSLPLNWKEKESGGGTECTDSVLWKFCDNEYLLDNIVRADDVRFKEPGPKEYRLTLDVSLPSQGADNSKVVFNADIPHAQIGAHALYSILENIVRNAAKYRSQKEADLNLCIELHEEWPDHWKTDNSRRSHKYWQDELLQVIIHHEGETGQEAAAALNEYLAREIVNRATGELESGQWGMKEMKICAAYLRMVRQEDIDSHFLEYRAGNGIAPPIIEVVWGHPHQVSLKKDDEESTERRPLHTTFYLLKPKDLLVIDGERAKKINNDEALRKEFMRQGVEFWALQGQVDALRGRLQAGFRLRHQIMVLRIATFEEKDWEWLSANLNALPCRLLLHGNKEEVPEGYREKIKNIAEFIEKMPDEDNDILGRDPEHWRLTVWNCWVQKRYGTRHSTGLPIYIRWERGDHDDRKVESLDGIVRLVSQSIESTDGAKRSFGDDGQEITDEELAGAIVFDHVGDVNLEKEPASGKDKPGYRVYDKSRFHESLDEGSPGRNIASGIIEDIGTDGSGTLKFPSRLMLRRLQEASVMTVGILDERLYESCQHESQKSMGAGKYVNIPLQEAWRRRGVYFLNHHEFLSEAPKGGFNTLDIRDDFDDLIQDGLLQEKGEHHYYDCLIVHEGLIEKWLTTHSANGQKSHWIDLRKILRSRARYLIITTGRGRPKTAEKHGWRWVEFSNLSDKIQHASKLQLVELLLAVKAVSNNSNGEEKSHD